MTGLHEGQPRARGRQRARTIRFRFDYGWHNTGLDLVRGLGRFHGPHDDDGWQVTVLDKGHDTLTGARIKQAQPFIEGDRFMVTYGDGVADIDIGALLKRHHEAGRLATVTGVRPPARFGEVVVEGDAVVDQHDTFWPCVDTARDLQALSQLWEQQTGPWKMW